MKIVFWNAHGLKNLATADIPEETDIFGITETWATYDIQSAPAGWRNFKCELSVAIREKSVGRASGGIMMLTNKNLNVKIIDKSSMWIFMYITNRGLKFVLGNIHVKPAYDLTVALELLQLLLDEITETYGNIPILMLGDFNARIGGLGNWDPEALENTCLTGERNPKDKNVNTRGMKLCDFMDQNGMIVLNGRTEGDMDGEFTFENTNGNSTIDLCWINVRHINLVENFTVLDIVTGSDHYPVRVKLNSPDFFNRPRDKQGHPEKRMKFCWDPSKRERYINALDNIMNFSKSFINMELATVDEQSELLGKVIEKAAEKEKMLKEVRVNGKTSRKLPWFDKELFNCKKETQKALREMRKTVVDENVRYKYLDLKKEYKTKIDKKKKEYIQDIKN